MVRLSAVIITYNEEKYIEQCIRSLLDVADEIVVVDSYSTDGTQEICLRYGVRFIQQSFLGYKEQKNFALAQVTYNHVLSLDADEALSIELKDEILRVKSDWQYDGYVVKRLNNYCGRWMYNTSLFPERKLRLFDRRKASWGGINPHDRVVLKSNSKIGKLKGNLLHWLYESYEEHLQKINHFSTISANDYFKLGIKPSYRRLILHPTWRFFHSYFIKTGFLEGFDGFAVSVLLSAHCFLKYYKLRRIYRKAANIEKGKLPNVCQSKNMGSNNGHKPIAIGFDAKRAFFNYSGLGNYSRNLINALANLYPKSSYILFTPKLRTKISLTSTVDFRVVGPSGFIFKFFRSLWRSKYMVNDIVREKVEVYHGLSHELPFGIEKTSVKTVVTVHDLIFVRFPHFFNPIDAYIYRKKIVHACRVAHKIVAISHQTKNDLVDLLGIDSSKIEVIHQGCGAQFWKEYPISFHEEVKQIHGLPPRYLLYVGTIEQRKNLMAIIKAKHEFNIELPLLVVGRKADYYHKVVEPYLQANKVKNVFFLEGVTNEQLPIVYQNAECFIYPSLFEGFGIPLLEALVSGVPVITSTGGCFSEAAGPSSLYIDPENHEELANAIIKLNGNPDMRNKMIASGKEYAQQFSDEIIAQRHMELYLKLTKEPAK